MEGSPTVTGIPMMKAILDAGRYMSYIIRAGGCVMVGFMALMMLASLLYPASKDNPPGLFNPIIGAWLLAMAVLSWPELPYARRDDPPTQRQLDDAASLGIPIPAGVTKGQLSEMIAQVTGQ